MRMLKILTILKSARNSGYAAVATSFPANAYISTDADFTGNTNGKQGIISFWINPVTISGKFIFTQTLGFNFYLATNGNTLQISANNVATIPILDLRSTVDFTTNAWQHILASWDLATGDAKLLFNGSDATNLLTATNDNIAYAPPTGWKLCGRTGTGINTCISEFYFAPNQYLDLSDPVNVSKFISAGKPVSLGANGSSPTGVQPSCYLRQNGGSILVNSGSGGDFNNVNGAVVNCGSSPSD